ncbi:hypothetical protein [Vibrio phage vB_VmeM-Yong XC32]|nr:hypothetical protein [Vibrio phage vB_VmeM-Yong XC31]QAX96546.1 hypothetical protein [Vibrio phage vB_VmeM-Yong XC32]QAX96864.1 hypothetical protein [Vibrio phage vB_VmeM-Yong MS31]QAX97169.1 hypothetical protein [Vibrio phage vB_VmeM-Yong MS32]
MIDSFLNNPDLGWIIILVSLVLTYLQVAVPYVFWEEEVDRRDTTTAALRGKVWYESYVHKLALEEIADTPEEARMQCSYACVQIRERGAFICKQLGLELIGLCPRE